jgi:IS30 family transposase
LGFHARLGPPLDRPSLRDRNELDQGRVVAGVQVYFCDPKSPWQRGSNENTDRLLRQHFPKGHPLDGYSQNKLNAIARELNERPSQTLNFATPAETLNDALTR